MRTRVSVFGLGYVGCVTAACLAKAGHEVIGVDISGEKVAMINGGLAPVVEPGLAELIVAVVGTGRLRATTSTSEAVRGTDLALICVGTPSRSSGQIDVSAVGRVAEQIGAALTQRDSGYLVVLRSTALPGTTEGVLLPALRRAAGTATECIDVAVNPEFMREGSSIRDFEAPALTLVGCATADAETRLRGLYHWLEAPFMATSLRTAEMVKYASNVFHAVKVCFANEIGDVCAALGADAQEVMRIFRMDRHLNVSDAYLRPGFAFGGSCLPKDVRAVVHAAGAADVAVPLMSAIMPSNEHQIRRAVQAVLETRKRRIGVVGLAFKAATDDLRESPMVTLVEALIGKGHDVRVLDPNVSIARLVGANRRYIEEEIPHIASLMCEDADALLAHAEVLVIGNAGKDAKAIIAKATDRIIIDLTRGVIGFRTSDDASD
jgi:GDP-mannose 6-dehydrogenase